MRGLSKAPRLGQPSPLIKHVASSIWVTASKTTFLPHLRSVAIRQYPSWNFRVVSDAELITAWLATVALKGKEIFDPDVRLEDNPSLLHLTLVDLVEPPSLLVIRLGVKSARNVAMSEVFLEALALRDHAGLPTWVFDQPDSPLQEGHLCYSPQVINFIEDWPHITLDRHSHVPERSYEEMTFEPVSQTGKVVFSDMAVKVVKK